MRNIRALIVEKAISAETPVVVHSREQEWLPLLNLAAQEVFEVMLGPLGTAANSGTPAGENFTAMVGLAGSLGKHSRFIGYRIRGQPPRQLAGRDQCHACPIGKISQLNLFDFLK